MRELFAVMSGKRTKPYVIAEISANHSGEIRNARKLIEVARRSGADAVKFQTFSADRITVNSNGVEYQIPNSSPLWAGSNLWELMKAAETPLEWHAELISFSYDLGLEVFSTAYDIEAVDFLTSLGVSVIKVSSFDLINIPLLEHLSQSNLGVVISTGMSSREEIDKVAKMFSHRKNLTAILQCTSSYPCQPEDVNLARHDVLSQYGFTTGLSDHTIDHTAATLAVAKGARVFEKHLRLDNVNSLDFDFSIGESQFKEYIKSIQNAFKFIGSAEFFPTQTEQASLWERPSVIALEDIAVGETLTKANIGIRRPSLGAKPDQFGLMLGKTVMVSIQKGSGVALSDVANL